MRREQKIEQSPAFQFYAGDWISNPGRYKMSLEEEGAFILLMCHCWLGKKLPFDWEILARCCNCSLDKIKKLWPRIEHMFVIKDNNIICPGIEEERMHQINNRKAKAAAGKKGAAIRWNNAERT